jgi:class 3 adenylate cyclase
MEKNIAILMADLSGYTALTETHGAISAADLIEKYIRIAANCLVGNTKIHERTGDEIMFISDSPDSLLATALKLEADTLALGRSPRRPHVDPHRDAARRTPPLRRRRLRVARGPRSSAHE